MPLYNPDDPPAGFRPSDHGWLAWNYDIQGAVSTTVMPTAGLVQITKVRLPVAASVTNVILCLTTAGSSLTAGQCFASLYTGAGALIAQTADQAASWASGGLKSMALAAGPFTCNAGNYYVAYWFNGTTGPTLARSSGIGSFGHNGGLSSPNFLWATADSSITTTAPANLAAQTGLATATWAAIS